MAIQLQLRKGTQAESDAFTGAQSEITVDTTNNGIRVHNGSTAGGIRIYPDVVNSRWFASEAEHQAYLVANEYESNIINGWAGNSIATGVNVRSNVIAGGGFTGTTNNITGVETRYGVISGGYDNLLDGDNSTEDIDAAASTIAGGAHHIIKSTHATIGGGSYGLIGFDNGYSTIAGGTQNTINNGAGGGNVISGGAHHNISARYCAISGGSYNTITDDVDLPNTGLSVIAGGNSNTVSGAYSNVSGGFNNEVTKRYSGIASGKDNTVSGISANIGGGSSNIVSADYGTIAGGFTNSVTSDSASVLGGTGNTASSSYAAVLGGTGNTASAQSSVALGRNATASGIGGVAWQSDNGTDALTNTLANSFAASFLNGFRFRTDEGVRITPDGADTNTAAAARLEINYTTPNATGGADQLVRFSGTRFGFRLHDDSTFVMEGSSAGAWGASISMSRVSKGVGINTTTPPSSTPFKVVGLPVYADNAAATTGGLSAGDFYRTSTGVVMVRY